MFLLWILSHFCPSGVPQFWTFPHSAVERGKAGRHPWKMPLFHSIWCVWILYHHYPGTKKPIPSSGGQSYVVNNTNTIQQLVAPPIMRKTLQKNSPFPFLHGQTNISSELLNVSSWIGNTQKIEQTDFKINKMLTPYSSVAVQFDQFSKNIFFCGCEGDF